MAFSGMQTAHIFPLVSFLTVVVLVNEKYCRGATIKKVHPALGKTKGPLPPLSHHNKEADYINTYVLACTDGQFKSKIV